MYDKLGSEDFDITAVEISELTPEEVKKAGIKRLTEIYREMRPLEQEKRQVLSLLSDPLKKQQVIDLTVSSARNIMSNCTLEHTEDDLLYRGFTTENKELLKGERSMKVNNLFSTVTQDFLVKEGVQDIKHLVKFDTRKVRQERRVGKTLDNLYIHKKQADQEKELLKHREQIAMLMLAQKHNEDRFEQIGSALLQYEDRLKALAVLGVEQKKIDLYRLSLSEPCMTQQELADSIGKTRLTVIRWLKDIEQVTLKANV
jgi:hypothetical protein